MDPCGGKEDQMFHKLAADKTSINFGPQRIQNARHSQGDDEMMTYLPRHCLAVGLFRFTPHPIFIFHPDSHDIPVFRPPAAP
jgi:hypothetical protein